MVLLSPHVWVIMEEYSITPETLAEFSSFIVNRYPHNCRRARHRNFTGVSFSSKWRFGVDREKSTKLSGYSCANECVGGGVVQGCYSTYIPHYFLLFTRIILELCHSMLTVICHITYTVLWYKHPTMLDDSPGLSRCSMYGGFSPCAAGLDSRPSLVLCRVFPCTHFMSQYFQ